jgi:hypothetical protein
MTLEIESTGLLAFTPGFAEMPVHFIYIFNPQGT